MIKTNNAANKHYRHQNVRIRCFFKCRKDIKKRHASINYGAKDKANYFKIQPQVVVNTY